MKYKVGDRVKHKKFGAGTVLLVSDEERTYCVQFDNYWKYLRDLSSHNVASEDILGYGWWIKEDHLKPALSKIKIKAIICFIILLALYFFWFLVNAPIYGFLEMFIFNAIVIVSVLGIVADFYY